SPDQRDYHVSFDKIRATLDFRAQKTPEDGIMEIYKGLKSGRIEGTPRAYTVDWYRRILEAKALVDEVQLNGRLLD
ncbi:MAG TPA: NAD(P)-dependent oxidoreductase, partial [bacterium]|nr:NAD(P)-dependent oxidoreductase [bacterium]